MGLEQSNQNYQKVFAFVGHISRVIGRLDRLYEFGPTCIFTHVSDIQSGHTLFQKALSNLTIEEINRGLTRIENLGNRKRVCPWPTEFAQICIVSDDDWPDIQSYYELKA